MKKAKIVKIVFEEGEYGLTQGHKAFEKPHYRNGRYVNPTGCGYAIESRPSHLIAWIIWPLHILNVVFMMRKMKQPRCMKVFLS